MIVTNASRNPSFAILSMSMLPGAVALRQAMNAMITANCTANQAQTPAAPQAIVASNPHGGGVGDAAVGITIGSVLIGSSVGTRTHQRQGSRGGASSGRSRGSGIASDASRTAH